MPSLERAVRAPGCCERVLNAAWSAVHDKFVAIGEGRSREAPTMQEVARLEDARAKRNAIERELNDFMTTRR